MRGRYPSGPEYVEHLEGSAQAKQRLRVLLQTMAGECRVQEACQRLRISEQRFDQLRRQTLQAAVHGLESKPTGRPRRAATAISEEVAALRTRVAELEEELQAARVREEIAVVLPRAAHGEARTGKKTTRRPPPR